MTLEELEQYRKITNNKITRAYFILYLFSVIWIFVFLVSIMYKLGNWVAVLVMMVGSSITYSLDKKIKKMIHNYHTEFKKSYVLGYFIKYFDNVSFQVENIFDTKAIEGTYLGFNNEELRSSDLISGSYKGISFSRSDLTIINYAPKFDSDSDKKIIIFDGQWYTFNFNKNFVSNLQIYEKNHMVNDLGVSKISKEHLIELEDLDFNNRFEVYSNNKHEAFYLLTPKIIEIIKEIDRKFNGKIIINFVNNKLHIGIHNLHDSFAPDIKRPLDVKVLEASILPYIEVITKLIDVLNLDNDLFKNE